eukprot:m.468767 g.468767  ORF g.468767 m.468767 type:complete len:76 (+) comp21647_c1_seq3:2889-3116(+)
MYWIDLFLFHACRCIAKMCDQTATQHNPKYILTVVAGYSNRSNVLADIASAGSTFMVPSELLHPHAPTHTRHTNS